MAKKKRQAEQRSFSFEEMSLCKVALIVAVDQSSTFTGHMGMTYCPEKNTEVIDSDVVLAIPEFKWLCSSDNPSLEHVINVKVSAKEKSPKYWPEVSTRLFQYEKKIAEILTKYENKVGQYSEKYFICESVYFDMLHLNSVSPLLRFQTVAAMTASRLGYKVFEYGNIEAKCFLGVAANKKNSKEEVVPFINSTFNLEIPSKNLASASDAEIGRCSHVGDAIALGYLHANKILHYLMSTNQYKINQKTEEQKDV